MLVTDKVLEKSELIFYLHTCFVFCFYFSLFHKLSSKAHFSKTVKPIGLAGQGDGSLPKSCIVSGWGTTNSNKGYMSHRLMEANVTLSDEEQCVVENSYCSQGDIGPGVVRTFITFIT